MFVVFVNLIKIIYIFLKILYFIVDYYYVIINILRKEKKNDMDEKFLIF